MCFPYIEIYQSRNNLLTPDLDIHASRWKSRRMRSLILLGSLVLLISTLGRLRVRSHGMQPSVNLVVASQLEDNTTWLQDAFLQWRKLIYVTDDASAALTVPENRGREAMVYLTYIIDHYDKLPDITIFRHANRYQWHEDDPLYDGLRVLERLQLSTVLQRGYVNLRCVHTLGCPVEIRPYEEKRGSILTADASSSEERAGSFYKEAFEQLFPNIPVPREIGASCCAQFAVTAEQIRLRSKTDYERYRRWLFETKLRDDLSGRILEYSWHIVFGQEAAHCPDAGQCYCDVFGLCNLTCEETGICKSQYTLARYSTLPEGWPLYGWEGEWRDVERLRLEQAADYQPRTGNE